MRKQFIFIILIIIFLMLSTIIFFTCNDHSISMNQAWSLTAAKEKEAINKAKHGDAEAAFDLYLFYETVQEDHKKALPWLKLSAEKGYSVAQYNLASLYEHENNNKDALYWYEKAAANGNSQAQIKAEEIEQR